MVKRKNTIISVCLFVLIFGALLITATFTDLQVSHILTKFSLPEGQYYADDIFGSLFATVGCLPIYLMLGFAFHLIFWNSLLRVTNKAAKYALAVLSTSLGVTAYTIMFKDTLGYIFKLIGYEKGMDAAFIMFVLTFLGCVFCFFATFAVRSMKDETIKNLLTFAIAVIIIAAVANGFVNIIKIPVGRMRYRSMNTVGGQSIGGFANFTRWYVFNGQMDKQQMRELFGTTDACKSFPSGHTCSAGMTYCLIMLIDALGIKSRGKKAALWICPVIYTGIVAVSRIMVGAHFFSDVLVGGTIAFVTMIIVREIMLCKFSHFKK